MPNLKLSVVAETTVVPDSHTPAGACPGFGARSSVARPYVMSGEEAARAAQRFPHLAGAQRQQFVRVSPAEIMATAVTKVESNSITLHLEGTIGGLPHSFDLIFALHLPNDQIAVGLQAAQPAAYEGSWIFKLHRVAPFGYQVTAVSPAACSQATLVATALPNLGGVMDCIIKCLGPQVIEIVLACLPSLLTGKQAFLACLIQQAQSSLPNVVQCIQQCQ